MRRAPASQLSFMPVPNIERFRLSAGCKSTGDAVVGRWYAVAVLIAAAALPCAVARAEVESRVAAPAGVVEGRVHYHADPGRPWRFARYYVRDAREGFLAEAVVALRGTPLKQQAAPAPREAPVVIDQQNFQFVPETAAIRVGDRVKFTNSDAEIHNVKTPDGAQPFSVNIPSGGAEVRTFGHAGGTRRPLRLGCAFHGAMRGWLFVFDHSCFQVTGADGRYRLENVPPGEYRLEMVHPAGDIVWAGEVRVEANRSSSVDIHVSPDHVRSRQNR